MGGQAKAGQTATPWTRIKVYFTVHAWRNIRRFNRIARSRTPAPAPGETAPPPPADRPDIVRTAESRLAPLRAQGIAHPSSWLQWMPNGRGGLRRRLVACSSRRTASTLKTLEYLTLIHLTPPAIIARPFLRCPFYASRRAPTAPGNPDQVGVDFACNPASSPVKTACKSSSENIGRSFNSSKIIRSRTMPSAAPTSPEPTALELSAELIVP